MGELIKTEDGTATLFIPALQETYHSRHGALTESRHVFIAEGLQQAFRRFGLMLNVLEVGFGTGLNALLTCQEAAKQGLKIWYTSLETAPISPDLIDALDYARATGHPEDDAVFRRMHDIPFNVAGDVTDNFVLEKRLCDVREFADTHHRYHLVYFDAFSPQVQPELWTAEVFSRIHSYMHPNGILVTYSAKGEVQRTMKQCGFEVEKVPGPPGKREMIRAVAQFSL